ncbi:pfs nb-arc and tpr domain protein (jcvi) [Anaeramoeba flamelloides]|uniref:Pfs nb-arc and tpr domain protein (Jcvi) n=1 Tax=Anaeramoeba flamelloides TaxID=1746091 RepID=A0AAV7ZRJ5_9EUKA|nr:pfs nb-arc and tpr domain protein (jcvi) [Anaeramoeba flamelloides]|eukprot:Anaeramoba_flamelloidesa1054921_53.p1 GENE.a1054921_53~~a1054921_53.p1  ORF type:complete len:495 (+),score=88.69 a1054921_53:1790-3274(+)
MNSNKKKKTENEYYILARSYEGLANKEKAGEYYRKLGEIHDRGGRQEKARNCYWKAFDLNNEELKYIDMLMWEGEYLKGMDVIKGKIGDNHEFKQILVAKLHELTVKRDLRRIKFEEQLEKIPQESEKDPTCYIAYAREEDVGKWLKGTLVQDLERAGIDIAVDFKNVQVGDSEFDHWESIREEDYVLLVATPLIKKRNERYKKGGISLSTKERDETVAIGVQLELMNNRVNDLEKLKTVIPILYKGDRTESIPTKLLERVKYQDVREEKNYYCEIVNVIGKIQDLKQNEIDRLTDKLEESFKEISFKCIQSEDETAVFQWKEDRENAWIKNRKRKKVNEETTKLERKILYNVPNIKNGFHGRKKELKKIKKIFNKNKIALITSSPRLGRVGKTELAKKYVIKSTEKGKYDQVFWISAEKLEKNLRGMIKELGIRVERTKSVEKQFTTAKRLLERSGKWLIVFDGVKERHAMKQYSPEAGGACLNNHSKRTGDI